MPAADRSFETTSILSTLNSTRRTGRADRWHAPGHRHNQPCAAVPAAAPAKRESVRPVPRLPGDMAPRDKPGRMAFRSSRWRSRRTAPIDFTAANVTIRVGGTLSMVSTTGMPTFGAASQIVKPATRACGPAADAGHALRDPPALHRARYVVARLSAPPQSGPGSPAIDCGYVHPRDDRRRLHRFSWINEVERNWPMRRAAKGWS